MGLPVACIQTCKLHRVPTVEHHPIPHIEAAVGHAVRVGRVVGVAEKYKVAGPWGADGGAVVIEPLGPQAAHVPAALVQHIGQEAGTVKGRGRGAAAPDVGVAPRYFSASVSRAAKSGSERYCSGTS